MRLGKPRFQNGWTVAVSTLFAALAIGATKFAVVSWCDGCQLLTTKEDFFRAFLPALLGGALFVLGVALASTIADYKESERLPAEFVTSLTSLYDDGNRMAAEPEEGKGKFDQAALEKRLTGFVDELCKDLREEGRTEHGLNALAGLVDSVRAMERAGLPNAQANRLRSELATIRRGLLRIYHMQWTPNIASANRLLATVIGLILTLLIVTKIGRAQEAAVATGSISYFFIYLVRLRDVLDRPFRVRGPGKADGVNLDLLDRFQEMVSSRRSR